MLALAAERLREFANARVLEGDAAELPLCDVHADLIVSRFGVMFFGDPVGAFANLRTGLAPGGRLRFACWRPINENPWLQIPLHAVYEHVPRLPKPDPEEPGPFSFADPARVTRILTAAGFTPPTFIPLDIQMDIAAGGTLEDAVSQSSSMGPTKRALADQPEEIRAAAITSIRRALAPYASTKELARTTEPDSAEPRAVPDCLEGRVGPVRAGDGVSLPGAVWLVAAENPA
jgi:SAM-dependent methyltransferase